MSDLVYSFFYGLAVGGVAALICVFFWEAEDD